jgi:hypothetical protein
MMLSDTSGAVPQNLWGIYAGRAGSLPVSQIKAGKGNIKSYNDIIAYYLKNAPKVFSENRKRIDKAMLMKGQGV